MAEIIEFNNREQIKEKKIRQFEALYLGGRPLDDVVMDGIREGVVKIKKEGVFPWLTNYN